MLGIIVLASTSLVAFTDAHKEYKAQAKDGTYWVFYDCSTVDNGILDESGNYTDDFNAAASRCPEPVTRNCAVEYNLGGVTIQDGKVIAVDPAEATGQVIYCSLQ